MNRNLNTAEGSSSSLHNEDSAPAREEIPPQVNQSGKVNKSEIVIEKKEGEDGTWKVPQKKAKLLRLERKLQKNGSLDQRNASTTPSKSLEDFLAEDKSTTPVHRLEIKLVNTRAPEFKDSLAESSKLYAKYQMSIHKDSEDECTVEQFKRFLVKSPLQVLSSSYPSTGHSKYILLFLSLAQWSQPDGGLPAGYGSFHQVCARNLFVLFNFALNVWFLTFFSNTISMAS